MSEQLIALPPKMPIIAGCAAAPRSMVEEIIEQLIASLDLADGEPDLEDDDPAGDPLDIYGEPPIDFDFDAGALPFFQNATLSPTSPGTRIMGPLRPVRSPDWPLLIAPISEEGAAA